MKRRKVWRPKLVRVVWLDAQVLVELDDTVPVVLAQAKLALRESSGWLLRYDDSLTVITRDYDPPAPSEAPDTPPKVGDAQIMPSILVLGVYEGKREVKRGYNAANELGDGNEAVPKPAASSAPKPEGAPGSGTAKVPSGAGDDAGTGSNGPEARPDFAPDPASPKGNSGTTDD